MNSANFSAVPAASCPLDPTVAPVLLTMETPSLLTAAKSFIQQQCNNDKDAIPSTTTQPDFESTPPALKKFKFLSSKISGNSGLMKQNPDSIHNELVRYVKDIEEQPAVNNAFDFWQSRRVVYYRLAPLAEDLVSAPASQAFVERIFSVTGMLTCGRRNRMEKSLENRVCLKLNSHIVGF